MPTCGACSPSSGADAPPRRPAGVHPLGALVLVAAGGAAGGALRQAVRAVAEPQVGTWGWATLVVNAVGAFALAALVTALVRRPSERTRLLVGTGLLGGLTTFSGLAVDAVTLADAGRPVAAAAYVAVAVLTLVGAAALGARTAAAVLRSPVLRSPVLRRAVPRRAGPSG